MAQFGNNPWALTSADVATAAIGAGTVTLNADGTVTVNSAAALTFNTNGVPPANWFTLTSIANAAYNGFYFRISGASGQGLFVLQPQFSIPAGTAPSTVGNITQCLYPWQIRAEDISWQNVVLASQTLDIRDRAGNIVWQASTSASVPASNSQNRGKIMWINGITPITIQSGIVLITVN